MKLKNITVYVDKGYQYTGMKFFFWYFLLIAISGLTLLIYLYD